MKRKVSALSAVIMVLLLFSLPSAAQDLPQVTIKVRGVPGSGLMYLGEGESQTFEVSLSSDTPFTMAVAMADAYYPGRGAFWHGGDHASQGTEAVLYLTITGKSPTADLAAVCGWPTQDVCWPDGVAPVAIAVGVRFTGGVTVGEYFPFAVEVP